MFERFDEPKPIGSGIVLQPTGLAVLQALNVLADILKLGQPIHRMIGRTMPSGKVVLNVDYSELPGEQHGLAVHRAALFDVLYARVNALQIPIKTATEIARVETTQEHIVLLDLANQQHGPFDLCIDASGASSSLHQHALIPPRKRMLRYGAIWGSLNWSSQDFLENTLQQRYVAAHTMIGVMPIGTHSQADTDQAAFFWSMRGDDYATWQARGLNAWKQQVRAIWPETEVLLEQIIDAKQMTFAGYGHHTLRKPYGDRLIFIGDAAHATSPQLGQGANMGLLDAWALRQALEEADTPDAAAVKYADLRRWHVRFFQLASLALTPAYQSDSRLIAALRDLSFDPVSRLPIIRKLVVGLISGLLGKPLQRLKLQTAYHDRNPSMDRKA